MVALTVSPWDGEAYDPPTPAEIEAFNAFGLTDYGVELSMSLYADDAFNIELISRHCPEQVFKTTLAALLDEAVGYETGGLAHVLLCMEREITALWNRHGAKAASPTVHGES